jgi:hypothetical protein
MSCCMSACARAVPAAMGASPQLPMHSPRSAGTSAAAKEDEAEGGEEGGGGGRRRRGWGQHASVGVANVELHLLEPKTDVFGLGYDPFKVSAGRRSSIKPVHAV